MSQKAERAAGILKRLVADFLERNSNRTSLLTVTSVSFTNRRHEAIVYMTVLPDNQEAAALDFANRQKAELGKYISSHSKFGFIPKIRFEIDKGEKNRQRIDFLSQND